MYRFFCIYYVSTEAVNANAKYIFKQKNILKLEIYFTTKNDEII